MKEKTLQQKYPGLAINLMERSNYTNKELVYLKNVRITEWDIASAGFSVIKFKKLFPENQIRYLENLPKYDRNVYIGKEMRKNPKISVDVVETLEKVRKSFVILNKIKEEDVLSVKKDAIFLINKKPETTLIKDFFQFREKSTYTSFLYLNKKEFYYDSANDILDVKGLSEKTKNAQHDFLLNDIKEIMKAGEKYNQEELYSFLKRYRDRYLSLTLPKETYKLMGSTFDDEENKYAFQEYRLDNIGEDMLEDIDISFNLSRYILPIIEAML